MLNTDELKMFRYELDYNFPMFSEREKEKLMSLAEHGTGSLIRALTCLAEFYLQAETGEGAHQGAACSEQMQRHTIH